MARLLAASAIVRPSTDIAVTTERWPGVNVSSARPISQSLTVSASSAASLPASSLISIRGWQPCRRKASTSLCLATARRRQAPRRKAGRYPCRPHRSTVLPPNSLVFALCYISVPQISPPSRNAGNATAPASRSTLRRPNHHDPARQCVHESVKAGQCNISPLRNE